MKKIIALLIVIFLVFFGGCVLPEGEEKTCDDIPVKGCFDSVEEKDCGTDLKCFNTRLNYCEKAKVNYTEETELGQGDGYKYFASKNSTAKITDFGAGVCSVETTQVQGKPITAGFRERIWDKTDCIYYTNYPKGEKRIEKAEFKSCYMQGTGKKETEEEPFLEKKVQQKTEEENGTKTEKEIIEEKELEEENDIPACVSDKDYFTASPIKFEELGGIIPLGTVGAGGGHIYPYEKILFGIKLKEPNDYSKGYGTARVYSPGDIFITEINTMQFKDYAEYSLKFSVCREVFGEMSFTGLNEKFKKYLVEPFEWCEEHGFGEIKYELCSKKVQIKVKAGEEMGLTNGEYKNTLNLGLTDLRINPLTFANPKRWPERMVYGVCPLDYFEKELKEKLEERLGNVYGTEKRTAKPLCGEINQDEFGSLQGVWLGKGTIQDSKHTFSQEKMISFVSDPVTAKPVIVTGTQQTGLQAALYYFEPEIQGYANRQFREVKNDGMIYCYDNLTDRFKDTEYDYAILVQLPTDATLKVGKHSKSSCTGSFVFSEFTEYTR